MYVTWCIFVLIQLASRVHGGAVVEIRFKQYTNGQGFGDNGHCCDGKWGVCEVDGCDHMFTICLDDAHSNNQTGGCRFGVHKSAPIWDHNSITFGDSIADLPNPVIFDISGSLPPDIALKVDVWDSDKVLGISGGHDHVDFLRTTLSPSQEDIINGVMKSYSLLGRTGLDVEVTIQCAPNWYSATCGVFCPPPEVSSHMSCDSVTGDVICEPGWTGPQCDQEDDEGCPNQFCMNGGTCIVEQGQPMCVCSTDIYGQQCEHLVCSLYCLPGTCSWRPGSAYYTCDCPQGFHAVDVGHGMSCEEVPPGSTTSHQMAHTTTQPPTTTTSIPVEFIDRQNADCDRVAMNGHRYLDGVYDIHVSHLDPFPVYCDMSSYGNGWTVIQRRENGDVSFDLGWEDYKHGFGEPGLFTNYWMGLEKIYHLTNQRSYQLQIAMQKDNRAWRYANYEHFWIESEANQYRLHVEGYSGTAGDALNYRGESGEDSQGMPFSTYDRDNDSYEGNCAQEQESGWWFSKPTCFSSNLNGAYITSTNGWPLCREKCISWSTLENYELYSLRKVVMKVLPNPQY